MIKMIKKGVLLLSLIIFIFSWWRGLYAPFLRGTDSVFLFLAQMLWTLAFHGLFCLACWYISNKSRIATEICCFLSFNLLLYAILRQITDCGFRGVQNIDKYKAMYFIIIGLSYLIQLSIIHGKLIPCFPWIKIKIKITAEFVLCTLGYLYFIIAFILAAQRPSIDSPFRYLRMAILVFNILFFTFLLLCHAVYTMWPSVKNAIKKWALEN